MKREDILLLCHSNPEIIVDHIESLVDHIKSLETELNEVKEEIRTLKALLNQNSQNSNKPPSTDIFVTKKTQSDEKKSDRLPGGQKGHSGSTLKTFDSPHEIVSHRLCNCKYCGYSLLETEANDYEKRQEVDLPPLNFIVTEHRSEIKKCPYCGRKNKADFPENITKPVQYSQKILAIAVYLRDYQLIPYGRISKTFKDLFGLTMSPATVKRAENKCFHNLTEVTNYIKEKLIKEDVIHCDETGMRVDKQNDWCHVISTAKWTYYFHNRSRGSKATKEMGILPEFRGIMVHDFWSSYFKYPICKHAMCNAHLKRELKGVHNNFNQNWAQEMSELLVESKKYTDEMRALENEIEGKEIEALKEKYNRIVMKGIEENPPPKISKSQKEKRGRPRQSKAKNLLDRFIKYDVEILRFATDLRVPFENNQAERDLRMVRVQQKISGTFRTPQGADTFCRNRGYISTIMKNMMSVIDSLYAALQGAPPIPE
jgi:Transposase and inactivated derivatives